MAETKSTLEHPAWVTPDEPLPVRLMNTIWADRRGVHDDLLVPEHLNGWLQVVGLAPEPIAVTKDDLATGRRLRDALRRLAALVTQDTRDAAMSAMTDVNAATQELNSVAEAATGPRLRLRAGSLERDHAPVGPPVPTALAAVATESIDLLTGAQAHLLRACYAPGCVLYFVKDHPRREWCSTACGNRARAARHYARHTRNTKTPTTS